MTPAVRKFTKKNLGSHLKTLGARRVTCSKFHTENPQILSTSADKLVSMAIWYPGFMHYCMRWNFRYDSQCFGTISLCGAARL